MRKLLSTWSAPIAVLLAGLCPFMLPARALAAVDTLEDIGPDGTEITSRVIDGVTVTISVSTGSVEARTYYDDTLVAFGGAGGWNIPLHPENVSGDRFIRSYLSFEDIKPIQFHFSVSIESFGLTTLDLLENSEAAGTTVELRAYNSVGSMLDEMVLTAPQGPSGLDLDWLVSSSNRDIVRVELTGSVYTMTGYGIDDLVLVVPEPATLSLLALGACPCLLARGRQVPLFRRSKVGRGWLTRRRAQFFRLFSIRRRGAQCRLRSTDSNGLASSCEGRASS